MDREVLLAHLRRTHFAPGDREQAQADAREAEAEFAALQRLAGELAATPTAGDSFSLRARASIPHDFCTGTERILVRFAEELNGGVPRGEQWHRQLLEDMALDLPGVRPQVITAELARTLGGYLRFRHLFGNACGFALDAERMRLLEAQPGSVLHQLTTQVQALNTWMVGGSGS